MTQTILAVANVVIGLVVTAAASVQAAPLAFTSARFDTVAYAATVAGAFGAFPPDTSSDASPPSPLPILSTAVARGSRTSGGFETLSRASALAGPGLLSASSDVSNGIRGQGGNARAQSHFVGHFLSGDDLTLHLGFRSVNDAFPRFLVGANATLLVLLTSTSGSTTTTLFTDTFTVGSDVTLQFAALGDFNALDLLLISETPITGDFQGNRSEVTFDGEFVARAIPQPATFSLMIVGLAAMLAVGRRFLSVRASPVRHAMAWSPL